MFHLWSLYVGERFTAKNYRHVILISVVSTVFEKLANNRIVDHLEKCGLFPDFQYGFRSSVSTADLLTVVSDRIAGAFNRSGATRALALDISKASFDRSNNNGSIDEKMDSIEWFCCMYGFIFIVWFYGFYSILWKMVLLYGFV